MELGVILSLVAVGIGVLGLLLFFGLISTTPFTRGHGLKSGLSTVGILLVISVVMSIVLGILINNRVLSIGNERFENRQEK